MKRTFPSKESTRKLIIALEKKGKKDKAGVWLGIAGKISSPTRIRAKVNLWKLSKLAAKNKGKLLVVPGKVLGTGELENSAEVAAFSFSDSAKKKIEKVKGKVISLQELIESKAKAS